MNRLGSLVSLKRGDLSYDVQSWKAALSSELHINGDTMPDTICNPSTISPR
jgi:hypothetical protein